MYKAKEEHKSKHMAPKDLRALIAKRFQPKRKKAGEEAKGAKKVDETLQKSEASQGEQSIKESEGKAMTKEAEVLLHMTPEQAIEFNEGKEYDEEDWDRLIAAQD